MILVTGGCGFIGAALVKALVRNGEKVRVLDNMSRGREERLNGVDVEIHCGDVRDRYDMLHAAQNGVDEIIHLACINGTKNFYERPGEVLDVGIRGMQSVLTTIAERHINKFIFVSSSEVYQDADIIPTSEHVTMKIPNVWNPRYSYAAVKIISEMQTIHNCKAAKAIILRPHNIYGPDMGEDHVISKMCRFISIGKPIQFGDPGPGQFYGPDETRAFCYIDDAIEQIMLIRRKEVRSRSIYNIGSEDEVTIVGLARWIAKLEGKVPIIKDSKSIDGSPIRRCPDMSLVKQLGYRPQYSLQQGLRLTLDWYMKERNNVIEMPKLREQPAAPGT